MTISDCNSNLANRTDLRGKGKGRKGISKGLSYLARVSCVEYELKGMLDAYGRDFITHLMDEILAGRINARQDVERWSAHRATHGPSSSFESVKDSYGSDAIYTEYKNSLDDNA